MQVAAMEVDLMYIDNKDQRGQMVLITVPSPLILLPHLVNIAMASFLIFKQGAAKQTAMTGGTLRNISNPGVCAHSISAAASMIDTAAFVASS
jgi:hypothetical protein